MNIVKFVEEFPDEKSCKIHLKKAREKELVTCKKCKCTKHWWLESKWMWQCSSCNFRTILRSGTIMESSKLSIRKWYLAMAFMTYSKKGISAKELQRQLSHKYYEPIWLMMHKLRKSMGQRDSIYSLEGMLEFDEAYFETEINLKKKKNLKRGKGSERQKNVTIIAESTPLEDIKTGKKSSHVRFYKMTVLTSHKAEDVDKNLKESIEDKAIVFSDKSTSYVNIADYVEVHITEKSSTETTNTTLKWVHIAYFKCKTNSIRNLS